MAVTKKNNGIYFIELTNGEYFLVSRRGQQCYDTHPNKWMVSYSDDHNCDYWESMIDTKKQAVEYARKIIKELGLSEAE